MEYIRICNWEKFQHYKKRNPPWIKLHTSLLDNEQFECLQDDSKLLLLCLWLFVARKGNGQIPADPKYLFKKLPISKRPKLQPLIDTGFIECYQDDSKLQAIDDSKVLASDRDRDRGETEQRHSNCAKDFETFWEVWPIKKDKGHAKKWWGIHKPDEQLAKIIIDAVRRQVDAGMLVVGDKYMPLATTWLNGERWTDGIENKKKPQGELKAECSVCGKKATVVSNNRAYCNPECRKKDLGW